MNEYDIVEPESNCNTALEVEEPEKLSANAVVRSGFAISSAYIVGLAAFPLFISESFMSEFKSLKPNELGDFLAGAFAPLAFLWLVIAVFVQKGELANQILEFRRSVNLTEQQIELLKIESEQRKYQADKVRIENKFTKIASECVTLSDLFPDPSSSVREEYYKNNIEECIAEFNKQLDQFNESQGGISMKDWDGLPFVVRDNSARIKAHLSVVIEEARFILDWNAMKYDDDIEAKVNSSQLDYLKINGEIVNLHL